MLLFSKGQIMTTKTSFPVTEKMVADWSENLENQPFHIDPETGEESPIVATSPIKHPDQCMPHGCMARVARSYNPGPAMPTADMSASQVKAL